MGRECWPHKLRVSSPVNQSTGSMGDMPLLPGWMEPIAHVVSTILLLTRSRWMEGRSEVGVCEMVVCERHGWFEGCGD